MFDGVFPEDLKCADVIPLLKKGSAIEVGNYMPISLLSVFSNIFEKVIKNGIMSFSDKARFFSPVQFGFQKVNRRKMQGGNGVVVASSFVELIVHSSIPDVSKHYMIGGSPINCESL